MEVSESSDSGGKVGIAAVDNQVTQLVFVSASVYDNDRTFLRIYADDGAVSAWSNIDFGMFDGTFVYRVHKADGTSYDQGLLLGLANLETVSLQQRAIEAGSSYVPPSIPILPDLDASGPVYQVSGDTQSGSAIEILEQLHDLFRGEGASIAQRSLARKQAEAAREAALLANPQEPEDVTIRYWKGESKETSSPEVAE
jgi:hypothetical protein